MIDCYTTAIEQAPPSMFQNKRAGFVRRTKLNHSDSVSLLEEPEQTVFRTTEELSQAISASNSSATAPLHAIRSNREHIPVNDTDEPARFNNESFAGDSSDEDEDEEISLRPRAAPASEDIEAELVDSVTDAQRDSLACERLLAHYARKGGDRRSISDDLLMFVNSVDLTKVAATAVKMLTSKPRSVSNYVPAATKASAVFKEEMEELRLVTADDKCVGPLLKQRVETLMMAQASSMRIGFYLPVMTMIVGLGQYRFERFEGKPGFSRSNKVVEYIRKWCSTPRAELTGFYNGAMSGSLPGSDSGIGGSVGMERLKSSSQFLANDMAEMFEGLLDFIAYESIITTSAQQKVAACVVEEGDTVHSLNMAEDEDFDTWKARWKKRSETALDACVACDQEWRMPCSEKDSVTMKAACSDKLWKKAAEILDLESVEYDLLPLVDAISLMETAQDKIDLAAKNRKVLKRNQRQPATPAVPAANGDATKKAGSNASGNANGGKGRTQTPFHLLLPGSLSGDCRFFALGTCNKGVDCPYKHKGAEKAQEAAAAAEERKRAAAAKTNAAQVKEAAAEVIRGRQGLPAPRPKTNCSLSKVNELRRMEEDAMRISGLVKEAEAVEDEVIKGRQGLPAPVETEVVQSKVICVLSKVAEMNPMEEAAKKISRLMTVLKDDRCDRVRMRCRNGLTAEERLKRSLDLKTKMIEALTEGGSETRVRLIGALTKGADPEGGSEESSESELDLSNDSIIDAIPEDHQQWLYRVSKGRQGSEEDKLNLMRSDRAGRTKALEKYSHEGFAVEGDRVNHALLRAHNATDILNSSAGTENSTDLESDDLSEDEHTSECEVIKIRKQMKAAGEREDFAMAGELQLKLKSLKKGLLKAAEKRGVDKEDLVLMGKHQSMKQLTMQQVMEKQQQDVGEMIIISEKGWMVQMADGMEPRWPQFRQQSAVDWRVLVENLAKRYGWTVADQVCVEDAEQTDEKTRLVVNLAKWSSTAYTGSSVMVWMSKEELSEHGVMEEEAIAAEDAVFHSQLFR